jgi:hypothetical protein
MRNARMSGLDNNWPQLDAPTDSKADFSLLNDDSFVYIRIRLTHLARGLNSATSTRPIDE